MKAERRANRRTQIETAAQAVLLERGYAGTSVLEVARRAKASNETLYRWYGDKHGLLAAIIKQNASAAVSHLESAISTNLPVEQQLTQFGNALLKGILSDSAIELNRAAAADSSGQLGQLILQHGRNSVLPLLARLCATASPGAQFGDENDAAETFIALLVGDLQARRIIGVMPEPDAGQIEDRARTAVARFLALARA